MYFVAQNFAAGRFAPVRETFVRAALIGAFIMGGLTLFCQWGAESVVRAFTVEPAAVWPRRQRCRRRQTRRSCVHESIVHEPRAPGAARASSIGIGVGNCN